jgi:hypothetical protein
MHYFNVCFQTKQFGVSLNLITIRTLKARHDFVSSSTGGGGG